MKKVGNYLFALLALALISAKPAAEVKYTLSKGYNVTIDGTSNLHDWTETVGSVTGNGGITWNADGTYELSALSIVMSVHSIKSTEGSMMDKNTYKALKADDDPDISFVLATPVRAVPAGAHVIAARINLTIAGVTKMLDMKVTATSSERGMVAFEGTQVINMTDYGINPPVALFGTLKTGNAITIHFKTSFTSSN